MAPLAQDILVFTIVAAAAAFMLFRVYRFYLALRDSKRSICGGCSGCPKNVAQSGLNELSQPSALVTFEQIQLPRTNSNLR